MIARHAIVDVHAHVTPRCFSDAVLAGGDWHGMTSDDGELHNPMNRWTLAQRVEAMDADGIDVQLTSPTDVFYQYHRAAEYLCAQIHLRRGDLRAENAALSGRRGGCRSRRPGHRLARAHATRMLGLGVTV